MNSRTLTIALILSVLCRISFAQEVKPYGYFLKDSVKIGEIVPYSLSYKDKKNRAIIFPDSLYNFAPFELFDKAYFDTESDSINSIDSAVYYLATFEIDTIQSLSVPVFFFTGKDSLEIFSNKDSIVLNQVVTQMPDSVNLEETNAFQPVSLQFNYPYWLIGLTILGIITLVVMLIWGKEIYKRIRLYRMKKKLENFKQAFDEKVEALNANTNKHEIEQVIKYWKQYMEGLENIPFTKLTTKEILKIQENSALEETLKSIDRSIYSKVEVTALQDDFDFLKDYSIDRYNHVTEQIRNA
ncbi:hypothetical protein BXY85_2777 [Roseivirga pacifica]|uniref:Oxygen tolerance n=1 Tax=Roseivirga pacifica TaxID=1267423 RepID=A0A1I0P8K8_9BACT|nr:hypothetical protein [Roseivirga pacifica]RKQ51745.1 hypothetical protein BXY85_2777 [Roseivirga pacifica]SEW09874.1 hypothetical protein SAMN05216290_1758 [Roseivirga pacifica]